MRFAFTPTVNSPTSLMPRLPLILNHRGRAIEALGLLDTGSAINLFPYQAGLALGAVWEDQPLAPPLIGILGRMETRQLLVDATHPQLTGNRSVELVFAWSRSEDAPVLFGQMNFFLEFDVCFYRAQGVFEIQPIAE
ncbi:MAG: hypothetical protein M3Z04_16870 [Chloroflexota bacterium]|nr:hypothetical protein [Chloroflexota bacterium]